MIETSNSKFLNKKNLIRVGLSIGFSLAILYYLFANFVSIGDFWSNLASIPIPLLLLSDLPYVFQTLLYGYRLKRGLNTAGFAITLKSAYWSHLFGMLCSNFLLGKLGYFGASLPLKKEVGYSDSTGVMSAIQSLDLIVKGFAALFGLLVLSAIIDITNLPLWVTIVAGGFIVSGILFLIFMWRDNPPFGLEVSKFPLFGKFLGNFRKSGFTVRKIALEIIGISTVGWLLRGVEWLILSYVCGINFSFIICLCLHPLLTIIRMIPVTLSGLGALELTLIVLFPSIVPEKLVLFGILDMVNNFFVDVIALSEIRKI